MTERRRNGMADTDVAVTDAPTLSASEAYTAKRAELKEAESQLASLQQRRAGGTRLTRDEQLDKLTLKDSLVVLRDELEALRQPMEEEVLALDVSDVTEVMNNWCRIHEQTFERLVSAMVALFAAKEAFIAGYRQQAQSMNQLPAYRNIREPLASGEETLANMLSGLPESQGWINILLKPNATLTVGQVRAMQAVNVGAQPRQEHHVARRVAQQRRQAHG